jgi:hypothetical protein
VWRKLEKSGENCKSGGEKKMYVLEDAAEQNAQCPSCMRTKVTTGFWRAPELNWATQRLNESDLCLPARDDAKRITATDIM